eukprot:3658105-Alexandrium_andersonii.AAC.1
MWRQRGVTSTRPLRSAKVRAHRGRALKHPSKRRCGCRPAHHWNNSGLVHSTFFVAYLRASSEHLGSLPLTQHIRRSAGRPSYP